MNPAFTIAGRRASSWIRIAICGYLPALILGLGGCGGGGSPPPSPPTNPLPFLSSLSPPSTSAGGPDFTLTVNGSGFISSSKVLWNGSIRTTTFVSSLHLTAAITAADITIVGTAKVTVSTPAPGGGTSNALNFSITGPTITSVSPASAVATGPGFTLTVNGSGFASTSTVNWNGAARPTTFVTSSQLTAAIPSSDISSSSTAQVTVFNPPNITSNSVSFTISPYTPPMITTTSLPTSETGKFYYFVLAVSGGAPPLTWALAPSSSLPPTSLALDSKTGLISGTVTAAASTNSFTVQVADSSTTLPPPATKTLHITVVGAGGLGFNNTCPPIVGGTAGTTVISNGTIRASISPYGDIDVYSFQGTMGGQVTIETFAQRLDIGTNLTTRIDFLDTVLELLDKNCSLLALNDDLSFNPHIQDSLIRVSTSNPFPVPPFPVGSSDLQPPASLPYSGTYYIRVRDFRSDGRPDLIYDLTLSGAN